MRLVLIFLLLCVFTRLQAQQAWINELHYDNQGVDTLEFVEVLLTSVPDTTGWKLWLYDGVSGLPYDSVAAGEWLPGDSGSAYQLYLWYPKAIQNGPDAIAIAHYNTLIEFISYEGSVTATGGVAMGHTATDLSASQGSDPAGISMQLTGSGSAFEHFWWTNTESTAGQLNAGQQFTREPTLLLFGAACADFGQVPFGASSQPEAWVVAGANLSADPDLHL
ncbi:MAG: hypothetical protein V2J13_10930, partial [Cycloclasticus sp.]|nr:hypothetical protein [Cycloclasticus sp.]